MSEMISRRVEALLKEKMSERDCATSEIEAALSLWRGFSRTRETFDKRASIYAAGAEYAMLRAEGISRTQATIASSYGTSTSQVSLTYREILEAHQGQYSQDEGSEAGLLPGMDFQFIGALPSTASPLKVPKATREVFTRLITDEATPGTIIEDFTHLLDALESERPRVSAKARWADIGFVKKLNERLSHQTHPIGLKRPNQTHYPYVDGLIALLMAIPMGRYVPAGKKTLALAQEASVVRAWRGMSPPGQYGALLWAWLRETISAERDDHFGSRMGLSGLMFLFEPPAHLSESRDDTFLSYFVGTPCLIMAHLFGLVGLELVPHGDWDVRRTTPTPLGRALWRVLRSVLRGGALQIYTEGPDRIQDALRQCIPGWTEAALEPARTEHRPGTWVWTASLPRVSRTIAIDAGADLDLLALTILGAVGFDNDHLYNFSFIDHHRRRRSYHHYYEERECSTTDIRIGDLPLEPGAQMDFLFDYGDCWRFKVRLDRITDDAPPKGPKVIASKGKAPRQYEDW